MEVNSGQYRKDQSELTSINCGRVNVGLIPLFEKERPGHFDRFSAPRPASSRSILLLRRGTKAAAPAGDRGAAATGSDQKREPVESQARPGMVYAEFTMIMRLLREGCLRRDVSHQQRAPHAADAKLVGERGFEPPAPASRRQCSTRLSYSPTDTRGPRSRPAGPGVYREGAGRVQAASPAHAVSSAASCCAEPSGLSGVGRALVDRA